MKDHPAKLTLHQETLRNLTRIASKSDTISPLCGPTYWETCEPCDTAR